MGGHVGGVSDTSGLCSANGLWRSLVSALDWGSRGPGFKSRQPDHEGAGQALAGAAASDRRKCQPRDIPAQILVDISVQFRLMLSNVAPAPGSAGSDTIIAARLVPSRLNLGTTVPELTTSDRDDDHPDLLVRIS
jgi:hypothetical protein